MTLECYFISGSPPCWTVMLALVAKGIKFTPKRLDNAKREQKSDAFLAINPRGNVPVVVDGDVVVRETDAILAYLDAAYPELPLFGTTPEETAAIWQVVSEAGDRLRTPIGNVTRPIFRGKTVEMADQINAAVDVARKELSVFETDLAGQVYLVGNALTAADLAVYPALMQLMRGATREGAAALNLGILPLAESFPNLAAWAARIEALPNAEAAYPPHWR